MRTDAALARGRSALGADGNARGGRDAELLLRAATGWERAYVLTHPEAELSAAAAAQYEASLQRRAAGEPVQYITGVQEFWGLGLKVTPAVLIPRPETEHLVEAVMARVWREEPVRIADVGTGSGAIAIALAKELPNATVVATDISEAALEVAGENAARHGVKERIQFEECDLLPAELVGALDVVAANPPYIGEGERETLAREVREFEPGSALFAGATGYEVYERLIPAARRALKADRWLVMEMGAGQEARLRELLAEWRDVSVVPDLQGIARVACARKR
jgi:release factor glutamine methyltransferase